MKNKIKYIIASAICFILGILTLACPNILKVHAEGVLGNGKWEVAITKDLPMGASYFSDTVIVEVSEGNYYLTFSILDKSNISKMNLVKGDNKPGEIIRKNGSRIDYTYTVASEDLKGDLTFNAYIVAMRKEKEFNIRLKLDTAIKLSDLIDDLGERPAIYEPKLEVNASDMEMQLGAYYQISKSRALIDGEEIPVVVTAYYIANATKKDIEITNDRFILDSVGEYHVIYRASSDKYKTSLGNASYKELDVKIICKINATTLAKVSNLEDKNTLPENISVQATKLDIEAQSFKDIALKLKSITDHYEAINLEIYDIDGNLIKPEEDIELYLYANPRFDRTKAMVYHVEDNGELKEVASEGFGRYMRMETADTGTFIIYVPGVPFVMPMWGYACILGGVLVIIAGTIATTVIVVKKKKKKNIIGN